MYSIKRRSPQMGDTPKSSKIAKTPKIVNGCKAIDLYHHWKSYGLGGYP